jgi:hypothetical protein
MSVTLMQIAFMGAASSASIAGVSSLFRRRCAAIDVSNFLVSAADRFGRDRPPGVAAHRPGSSPTHQITAEGGWCSYLHSAILFFVIAMARAVRDRLLRPADLDLRARHAEGDPGLFGFVSGMVGVGLLAGTQIIRRVARQARSSDTRLVLWGCSASAPACCSAPCRISPRPAATFTILRVAAIVVPAKR